MMKILDVVIGRTKKNANNVRLEYGSSFKHLFCIIYCGGGRVKVIPEFFKKIFVNMKEILYLPRDLKLIFSLICCGRSVQVSIFLFFPYL